MINEQKVKESLVENLTNHRGYTKAEANEWVEENLSQVIEEMSMAYDNAFMNLAGDKNGK